MTYCVGLLVREGLAMLADTRTNAGVDNISTYRKLRVYGNDGERLIAVASAGSLSTTQAALERVQRQDGVHEIRQRGLMAGIDLAPQHGRFLGVEVCERARAHGVILRPLGDVVVWMPPLSLTATDLELLEGATAAALAEVLG